MVSTDPTTESTTAEGISHCQKTIRGQLEVVMEPGNLRARVSVDGEAPVELRLPGDALKRALLFDGQDARVSYRETSRNGTVLDQTVGIVNRGEPMSGEEFVQTLHSLFETEEDRQSFLDSFDRFWPNHSDE